ncbi:MAG: putative LPS assembly protein LptD, partial [Bacteroidales bacterium]
VLFILLAVAQSAEITGAQNSTMHQFSPDSLLLFQDTISPAKPESDSLAPDMKISPGAVESIVYYKSEDSIRLDMREKMIYMYNSAEIIYQDMNLKANYVEIEFTTNEIYATGSTDSLGKLVGKPVFTIGENTFASESMRYNFVSKKGLVNTVLTEDSEGYIHGRLVKKMPDNNTNVLYGSYTTCDQEDHPHFEFRFKKAKVIPDKKIVTGPAFLVIEDVPTPLFVPFGLFPNKKGQRSGIVIPTYGESAQRGFYFENGGYYAAINEHLDLKLVGDIYTLGSWAVKPAMNYRKRYKYNGFFNANYAINILGDQGSPDYSRNRDFSLRWLHNQDPKARPKSKFSANVNIVSSQYNKFNPVSSNAYLSNTFQSSVNYSTNFANKYFLSTSLSHSQNTITREMDLTLPAVTFNVNRFYPFRAKNIIGKLRWYDNISVNYNLNADNRINTYDTLLFSQNLGSVMKNGVKHSVTVSSGAIKIRKHYVWTNSFNYTERWYSQQHVRKWVYDPLYFNEGNIGGAVAIDTLHGFNAVRDFNFSSSLNTTVYGMYSFIKGPVRAVRHVFKPSLSFSIRPDFGDPVWGYYRFYTNQNGVTQKYSPYNGFIYGTAPDGRSGALGLRLSNSLEMKVRSKKDTVAGTRKVVLIEDFSMNTGYDFARDSLNLNKLILSGRTTLFKQLMVNYGSSFDPYVIDSNGRRLNRLEWNETKRLLRPENHSVRFGLSWQINSEKLTRERKSQAGTEQELEDIIENIEGYVDWNVPWSLNISYDLNYTLSYIYRDGYWNYDVSKDKRIIQTLGFYGDVNITSKWKVGFRSGYDFETKSLTYTSIDVYRDLHCWEMRFNWIPIGFRQSWNFTINIKSSMLQDLKLDKKKDFRDF